MTRLVGHVAVPGDKSISHRVVLIGAICDGETRISGFGRSADTEATIAAVRALGVEVYEHGAETLRVFGKGLGGLKAPGRAIDCANAGTLVRLLAGILAGQDGEEFELTGDASLSQRPMGRIAEPLERMGAGIETTEGRLPLGIQGRTLRAIDYELPGRERAGEVLRSCSRACTQTVRPPSSSRHRPATTRSECSPRPARPSRSGRPASPIRRAERLVLDEVEVPGDFSSAAPFVVAATLVPGSELHLHGVNLNPRRTGLLEILERMGARITRYNRRLIGGEPAGDLEVRSAPLVGTTVGAKEVPLAIDELPLVALAAACARGETVIRGAAELRAKETDRIEATVDALRALGVRARGLRGRVQRARRADAPPRRPDREPRRPPDRDARRRRGARVPRGRADRGAGVRCGELPRLLRDARRASSRLGRGRGRPKITSADDRRDRRACGRRQELRRARARGSARLPLPRHGGDVPRARVARAGRASRSTTAPARGARPRIPVAFGDDRRVAIDGADVTTRIREPAIDAAVPVVARHPDVREVMSERQRALGERATP